MKIDFHTQYNKGEHINLLNNALRHGLDALVMTGLPEHKQMQYHNLRIFSADLVKWSAVLEIPNYGSKKDLFKNRKKSESKKVFSGNALVLLPCNVTTPEYDSTLFDLLSQVSELGGITIALQDDSNYRVTNAIETGKHVYPFDAIRIRPYNSHDINSELPFTGPNFSRIAVAGSGASESYQLENSAFTVYEQEIMTQGQLIAEIKKRTPTRLLVLRDDKLSRIEDTVKPLKII